MVAKPVNIRVVCNAGISKILFCLHRIVLFCKNFGKKSGSIKANPPTPNPLQLSTEEYDLEINSPA